MNTLEFINQNKNEVYSTIRSLLFTKYCIKSVETPYDQDGMSRIILTFRRDNSLINNPICQECNGLILQHNIIKNEYSIICYPTHMSKIIHHNYISNSIKKKIGNYEICKIYDGTIINMYYYNNAWKYSTSKGYDVGEKVFYDGTYKQIFEYIISKNYPSFNYDMLDKNKCYTFCFKYNNYHMFNPNYSEYSNNNEIDNIVFLQAVNIPHLKNGNVEVSKNENLPFLTEEIDSKINNIDQLIEICKTEYHLYLNSRKFKKFNYEPTYGFLLKEKRGKSENIIIYTNLYEYIKKILYVSAFNKNISNHNNVNLTILSVYLFDLKTNKNYNIVNIFPQCRKMFNFIKKFIFEKIPTIILTNMLSLKKNDPNNINVYNFNIEQEYEKVFASITNLCVKIYNTSIQSFDFSNKDDSVYNYKSIIQDFIINDKYVEDYFSLYLEFKNFGMA